VHVAISDIRAFVCSRFVFRVRKTASVNKRKWENVDYTSLRGELCVWGGRGERTWYIPRENKNKSFLFLYAHLLATTLFPRVTISLIILFVLAIDKYTIFLFYYKNKKNRRIINWRVRLLVRIIINEFDVKLVYIYIYVHERFKRKINNQGYSNFLKKISAITSELPQWLFVFY